MWYNIFIIAYKLLQMLMSARVAMADVHTSVTTLLALIIAPVMKAMT